jgi:hypothetical protein
MIPLDGELEGEIASMNAGLMIVIRQMSRAGGVAHCSRSNSAGEISNADLLAATMNAALYSCQPLGVRSWKKSSSA